jgi:lipoprotein-releasing system permease protein
LGLFVAWLQIQFEIVKMGNGSFVIDSYPVVIEGFDVAIVILTVLIIGSLASIIPTYRISKRFF